MKIKLLKSVVLKHKQRSVVALMLFVCLIFLVLITGSAQLRNQKRVMALQLGDAAEGSRVTVVSDAALNDYEAFRRGDTFYVKIPQADFNAAFPQLRADGFEAAHVQKVGGDVVVSFKLQPGATARVEQGGNRLNVIFSSPSRTARNSGSSQANRLTAGSNLARTTPDREPDRAGPLPGGSELAFRPRVAMPDTPDGLGSRVSQNSRSPIRSNVDSIKNSNRGSQLSSGNVAAKSPSPVPSPTSMLSPATSHTMTFPPLAKSSPAAAGSNLANNSAGPSASPGSANTKTQGNRVVQWIGANRLAALLGALILLALILYVLLGLRSRGEDGAKAKRLKALKAQPKVSPKVEPTQSPETQTREIDRKPALAAAAGLHSSELTKPSIATPVAGQHEQSEEEEREVFEL